MTTSQEQRAAALRQLGGAAVRRPLIVASNRGPVEHQMAPSGLPEARRGSGSVVTALNFLSGSVPFTWVSCAMGEADRVASQNHGDVSFKSPLPGHQINLRYVVTPRRVYHKYYNVICNPLLWFLQHWMWNPPYNPTVDAAVHEAWANGYMAVNQAVARAVAAEARALGKAPLVLGHDYHLYLLPGLTRQELPQAVIQHFIHIPWPAPSAWQLLPAYMPQQICASLCQADVVGFQTPQDRRAFAETILAFLPGASVDYSDYVVSWQGRQTRLAVYPISINPDEVKHIANSPRVLEHESRLRALSPEATIARVDRAEPNKNIIRGFRAYELLLQRFPEWRGKVNFLAFLVPSRTHVRQYQRYMDEIAQAAEEINRALGNPQWQPIHLFLENNYTLALAGMRFCDVFLCNCLAEGMSLVAKEAAAVNTNDGVLLLSPTTGGHHQLCEGAVTVAAADVEGTMQALRQALIMPREERRRRAAWLHDQVCQGDIIDWLHRQFVDLDALL